MLERPVGFVFTFTLVGPTPVPPSSALLSPPRSRQSLLLSSFPQPLVLLPPTPIRQSRLPLPLPTPIANVAAHAASKPPLILHSDTRTATAQTLPLRRLCPPSKLRLLLQCHRVKAGPHRSSLRPHATPHKARRMLPSTSAQTRTSRSGQARASAWVLACSQRAGPASTPSIGTAEYGQSTFPTPTP